MRWKRGCCVCRRIVNLCSDWRNEREVPQEPPLLLPRTLAGRFPVLPGAGGERDCPVPAGAAFRAARLGPR